MNELLKMILSLSLSGALLILVLLLCKPLVKDKLSKRWQYYIWLIVVARLLLPFAPETNLMGTVFQHFDNAVIQTDTSLQPEQEPSALPEKDSLDQAGNGEGEHLEPDKVAAPSIFEIVKQNIAVICFLVWLIVAIGLLIRKVTVYQSFVKYITAGRIEISDMQLWERVGKLVEQTGIKGAVGLYTNSLISSPLLIGFFRPCIMLPTTELSESDFENTILHELTHYKRRDMFYKWLVQLTICLHWFNPLAYIMGREINRACELSCDEAVIKFLNIQERRAYGDTLLNAMSMGGKYKDSLASVTLSESTELLKERLDAIMSFKKKSKIIASISSVLAVFLLCGSAYAGAYTGETIIIPKNIVPVYEQKDQDSQNGQNSSHSTRVPDNMQTETARATNVMLIDSPNVDITLDNNASVKLVPTSDKEITVDYGSTLYDVSVENEKGNWKIHITYIGSYSKYTAAVLHIPDIIYGNVNIQIEEATIYFNSVFQNCEIINTTVNDYASIFYTVPTDFNGVLNMTAPNCYLELLSNDGYKNCDVTISGCETFGEIANGFTKQDSSLVYSNGTKVGVINIGMEPGGYASIISSKVQ